MNGIPSVVSVTLTVNVNGQEKEFTTTTSTNSNPYRIARGLVDGLRSDSWHWLSGKSTEEAA